MYIVKVDLCLLETNKTAAKILPYFGHSRGRLFRIIIQQNVTLPIDGKEAINICHLYMTDILRYT